MEMRDVGSKVRMGISGTRDGMGSGGIRGGDWDRCPQR